MYRGVRREAEDRRSKVALRDAEGVMLAVIHVEDIWEPDREAEAKPSSARPTPRTRPSIT